MARFYMNISSRAHKGALCQQWDLKAELAACDTMQVLFSQAIMTQWLPCRTCSTST